MRVLAVRLSAFGDVLHLLPGLEAAGRAAPKAELHLLTGRRLAFMGERSPFVHRTHVLPPADQRFDLVVDCQGLMKTAWLARRIPAPRRAGFGFRQVREKPAALLYDTRVFAPGRHVIQLNCGLVAGALGVPAEVDMGYRSRHLVRADAAVEAFLGGVGGPLVLVHPASSQRGKHLRAEEWAPLLGLLVRAGYGILLSCGPGEEAVLEPWRRLVPTGAPVPVFPLDALPRLVSACALVVAADTGILHLADQLGLPSLSWFSLWPPWRNGPFFSPHLVFHRRTPDTGEAQRWLDSIGLL